MTNVPCEVGARVVRVQDGAEAGGARQRRAAIELAGCAHPKCTLSTLTPSGSSASAALPAIPPSCSDRMRVSPSAGLPHQTRLSLTHLRSSVALELSSECSKGCTLASCDESHLVECVEGKEPPGRISAPATTNRAILSVHLRGHRQRVLVTTSRAEPQKSNVQRSVPPLAFGESPELSLQLLYSRLQLSHSLL